jgi:hypothetical protein
MLGKAYTRWKRRWENEGCWKWLKKPGWDLQKYKDNNESHITPGMQTPTHWGLLLPWKKGPLRKYDFGQADHIFHKITRTHCLTHGLTTGRNILIGPVPENLEHMATLFAGQENSNYKRRLNWPTQNLLNYLPTVIRVYVLC